MRFDVWFFVPFVKLGIAFAAVSVYSYIEGLKPLG
jgi:hypothetical protein